MAFVKSWRPAFLPGKTVRYKFMEQRNKGSGLSQQDIESLFQKACDQWAAHCGLSFQKVDAASPSEIGLTWDSHTDTCAYTQEPARNIIHFNDNITWGSISPHCDFMTSCLHELGHVLGMEHSSNPSAVMYYRKDFDLTALTADDISGARALYNQPAYVYEDLISRVPFVIIENRLAVPISYKIYKATDWTEWASMTRDTVHENEILTFPDVWSIFNPERTYKIKAECDDQASVHHLAYNNYFVGQSRISFEWSPTGKLGVDVHDDASGVTSKGWENA